MQALERYYRARYERFKSLLKWREQLPELLEAVKSVLPDAEVYIFGSALRGELTANSDVDVLVASDKAAGPQRHQLAAAIEEKLKTPLIFEIHLVAREKLDWYKRHAKELIPAQQLTTSKASTGQPSPRRGETLPSETGREA